MRMRSYGMSLPSPLRNGSVLQKGLPSSRMLTSFAVASPLFSMRRRGLLLLDPLADLDGFAGIRTMLAERSAVFVFMSRSF